MKKFFIALVVFMGIFGNSEVIAQSKMTLITEYFVKNILIPPIDVKITERYIGKEKRGVKPIVIKAKRKGIYSDSFIKEKLNEITKAPGSFGPESGFGENIEILTPWQKRKGIKEVSSHTYWKIHEKSILNILLADNQITFIMFDNFKNVD